MYNISDLDEMVGKRVVDCKRGYSDDMLGIFLEGGECVILKADRDYHDCDTLVLLSLDDVDAWDKKEMGIMSQEEYDIWLDEEVKEAEEITCRYAIKQAEDTLLKYNPKMSTTELRALLPSTDKESNNG